MVLLYLILKGAGKSKTFRQAAIRKSGQVIDLLGDHSFSLVNNY